MLHAPNTRFPWGWPRVPPQNSAEGGKVASGNPWQQPEISSFCAVLARAVGPGHVRSRSDWPL